MKFLKLSAPMAIFDWQCHKKAFVEVLFHAAIGLVPLTVVLVMLLLGNWGGWGFFWENGEFYIYSVVFLTSALYLLLERGVKDNLFIKLLVILIVLAFFSSVVLYGSLITLKLSHAGSAVPGFLAHSSLWLLTISIVIFYIATYWKFYQDDVIGRVDYSRDGVDRIIDETE